MLEQKYNGCDPPCLLDSSDGRFAITIGFVDFDVLFVEFAAGADDNDNNYNDDTHTRANSELMMKMKILVVVAIMMTMTTKTITMMMMMVMMTMMMIMKMTRRFVLKGAGYNPMDVLNCLMTRRGYKVASNTIFLKTSFHQGCTNTISFKTSFHHLFCTRLYQYHLFPNQSSSSFLSDPSPIIGNACQ